jgi:hypothetical protein
MLAAALSLVTATQQGNNLTHAEAAALLQAAGYTVALGPVRSEGGIFINGVDINADGRLTSASGEISKGGWRAAIRTSMARGDGQTVRLTVQMTSRRLLPGLPDHESIKRWAGIQQDAIYGVKSRAQAEPTGDLRVRSLINGIVNFQSPYAYVDNKVQLLECVKRFQALDGQFDKTFGGKIVDPMQWAPPGRLPPESLSLTTLCYDEVYAFQTTWNWKYPAESINKPETDEIRLLGVGGMGMVNIPVVVEGVLLEIAVAWEPWMTYSLSAEVPVEKGRKVEDMMPPQPKVDGFDSLADLDKVLDSKGYIEGYSPHKGYYVHWRMVKLKDMTVGSFKEDVLRFARRVKALCEKGS